MRSRSTNDEPVSPALDLSGCCWREPRPPAGRCTGASASPPRGGGPMRGGDREWRDRSNGDLQTPRAGDPLKLLLLVRRKSPAPFAPAWLRGSLVATRLA